MESLGYQKEKKKKKKKEKRTLMKSNIYIKKNTHLIELFAIPKKKKKWLIKFPMFQNFFQS